MPYYTYWLIMLYLTGVAADAKVEARKWRKKYERKHLMFKMATEEFNKAFRLLTHDEKAQVREIFDRNEQFLNVVMGEIGD